MLSSRCQNSQKSENARTSEVNSNFFSKICLKHDIPLQLLAFIILAFFAVPFYHFLFSGYLGLTKHHFSSDILVSFPDSSDLYSRGNISQVPCNNAHFCLQGLLSEQSFQVKGPCFTVSSIHTVNLLFFKVRCQLELRYGC